MGDRHHKTGWKLITSGVVWKLVRGMCFSRTKEKRTKEDEEFRKGLSTSREEWEKPRDKSRFAEEPR